LPRTKRELSRVDLWVQWADRVREGRGRPARRLISHPFSCGQTRLKIKEKNCDAFEVTLAVAEEQFQTLWVAWERAIKWPTCSRQLDYHHLLSALRLTFGSLDTIETATYYMLQVLDRTQGYWKSRLFQIYCLDFLHVLELVLFKQKNCYLTWYMFWKKL